MRADKERFGLVGEGGGSKNAKERTCYRYKKHGREKDDGRVKGERCWNKNAAAHREG